MLLGAPLATTSPYTSTVTTSAKPNTTLISCSIISNVLPSVMARISATAYSVSLWLIPAVGSSSRITSAPPAIVMPISSVRWFGIGEKPGWDVAPRGQIDVLKNLRGALAHFRQLVDVLPERITVAGRPKKGAANIFP